MIREFKGITPDVSPTCFIADTAEIIGKVKLDKNVNVWFGAVIRGDIEMIRIGENSNVQDNCTIHTSKDNETNVGKNTTIGHNAVLHGCNIGDNCLIGMNAVVLDGAIIEDGVIVAAGSVVPPGKVLLKNTLYKGAPVSLEGGKSLSKEDVNNLTEHAMRYVSYSDNYK